MHGPLPRHTVYALPYRLHFVLRVVFLSMKSGRLIEGFRSLVETYYQETVMNKDQVKGRIKKTEGKIKEVTGDVVGNKTLEEKGRLKKNIGKVQAGYGDLKKDLNKDVKKRD